MTTQYAPPSGDPADDDSLVGTLRQTFKKFLQQTDDMLPAVVMAYDRAKNRAQVAPAVTLLTTDGRAVPRAQIASVPVMQFGGGGVVLNFKLKPGDLGWIKASDRDISAFLQSFKTSPPNTLRLHSFQDAVFIPDVMRGWSLAGEDADNAVLQTLDGNCKVTVGAGGVKLKAGASTVTLTPAGITIAGPVTVTGGLTVDGIAFGSHKHSGVVAGGAISGGPQA